MNYTIAQPKSFAIVGRVIFHIHPVGCRSIGGQRPGHGLHAAIVDARGHAKAVQFYFVDPLRPRGRDLSTG